MEGGEGGADHPLQAELISLVPTSLVPISRAEEVDL